MAEITANIYSLFRSGSVLFAILALAYCGLRFITGDQHAAEQAWANVKNILLALAAIWLLVYLIRLGRSAVASIAWMP